MQTEHISNAPKRNYALYLRRATLTNDHDVQQQVQKLVSAVPEGHTYTLYKDIGYSGRTPDRPALKRLLEDVKSQDFQYVVIPAYYSLARDDLLLLDLNQHFKKRGVDTLTLDQITPPHPIRSQTKTRQRLPVIPLLTPHIDAFRHEGRQR
ncbi:recombinase family protein [Teredinibacter sp. KSP-S5-2]|uniref:recombinase family protein n=1 Tax=Teredinibacter sp. KSP-S5-2 TaxID=3034506 RepID=UPI002934427F|nr:recombinase family protein [Teredinibacter sp. KSP-S5-2]WNO10381.1 recombinase family protein [Teredinibacter sp. KSP-S5-2]